jgi:predicted phosphodiesterase
LLFR